MSEICVATDRFWREFKTDVAGSLTTEQRGEIERVLGLPPPAGNKEISDVRLSFRWFFVRLAWGPEKRKPERIKKDEEIYPVMSRRNAPMLVSLLAGYALFWYMLAALAVLVSAIYLI